MGNRELIVNVSIFLAGTKLCAFVFAAFACPIEKEYCLKQTSAGCTACEHFAEVKGTEGHHVVVCTYTLKEDDDDAK